MPVESIHELDESGRPIMSAAYEEESLEDETATEGIYEPRVNKILRHVRNICGLSGGGLVGLITVAHPDDSPAGKIAQAVGGAGILLAIAGVGAGAALSIKESFWDKRNTERPSTYEGEQY